MKAGRKYGGGERDIWVIRRTFIRAVGGEKIYKNKKGSKKGKRGV